MPPEERHHFDAYQFWSIVGSTARNVAGVLIAFAVLWAGLWTYVIQPQADVYFETKLKDLKTGMDGINTRLDLLQSSLPEPRPFLEIRGNGKVVGDGVFRPGDFMTALYMVRRNSDCPTDVNVQFWDSASNSLATEYGYTTRASQIPPSFGFQIVSVRVGLPRDMRPGFYSYVPTMVPDRSYCPGETNVQVEPSDFFEVIE